MSYVEQNLMNGEEIRYRARLSKGLYRSKITVFGLLFMISLVSGLGGLIVGGILFGIPMIITYFNFKTSEFVVTNKRVIIKVGIISRKTLELQLIKIESVTLSQGIFERISRLGTVIITGSGGTKEPFTEIDNPAEFKRQVQIQIDALHSSSLTKAGT